MPNIDHTALADEHNSKDDKCKQVYIVVIHKQNSNLNSQNITNMHKLTIM